MSGDSFPLDLPLPRFATDSCEATTLFRELRKPLLRYLAGLGLSADEAQDVVQDAFLSLHQHLSTDGSQANIRSWLFRVAHNRARNCQQSYTRRMGEPLDPVFDSMSREATPEQAVLAQEKFHRLDRAIRSLDAAGTGVPHAARRRIALSRNRRSAGDSNLHGGRHSGARDQEVSGEMQCVTFQDA